ncbi:Holliday junction resolvase RuvX [Candidatus Shapirobacteria bacterium]|nr:Holliday junction resolvase RuvX [Candidatus Shapirobacteria bacterium]
MKILGIDFGLKKIGLALGEGQLAQPFDVLKIKKNPLRILPRLVSLCQQKEVEKIVIGLPETGLVKQIKEFGQELENLSGLPVFFHPETLTTQDALAKMKQAGIRRKARQQKEDACAAALILQDWLDQINV